MSSRKCWTAALAGILLLTSPGLSAEPTSEAYLTSKSHLDKADFVSAIATFTEAIRLAPKFADAYHNRGRAYQSIRDYDKAIPDYTEAIRLNPKYADAYWGRAGCYMMQGEKAKAEADFAQSKKLGYTGR